MAAKKNVQFRLVQPPIGTDAAANIQPERPDFANGFRNVVRIQAAGEKDGDADGLADDAADGPIVPAARAAEFLDGELLVTGIQQQGVNMRGNGNGLIHRFGTANVYDLHE